MPTPHPTKVHAKSTKDQHHHHSTDKHHHVTGGDKIDYKNQEKALRKKCSKKGFKWCQTELRKLYHNGVLAKMFPDVKGTISEEQMKKIKSQCGDRSKLCAKLEENAKKESAVGKVLKMFGIKRSDSGKEDGGSEVVSKNLKIGLAIAGLIFLILLILLLFCCCCAKGGRGKKKNKKSKSRSGVVSRSSGPSRMKSRRSKLSKRAASTKSKKSLKKRSSLRSKRRSKSRKSLAKSRKSLKAKSSKKSGRKIQVVVHH